MVQLSVIIAAYQAEKTIERAINSVLQTGSSEGIEIVVIDDCSSDHTCEIVHKLQNIHSNIVLHSMPCNTGSPSEPRNVGVCIATGEYVTFLDDDDELLLSNLLDMLANAKEQDADFAKGYLICDEKGQRYEANRLPKIPMNKADTIQQMIAFQSMTQDFIVKRELLIDNNLKYPGNLKIGEDTVFILSILSVSKHPIYLDTYFLIYNKTPDDIANLSSTQNCNDREICDQIIAWKKAQEIVAKISLNYYKLRLPATFRNLLLMIVRYSNGIKRETYLLLYQFAVETKKYTANAMNLSARYQELYDGILSGEYQTYCKVAKRRMVIAGYDLKFILPVIPYLKEEYEIKVDEWTGHNSHNEKQSKKLAEWADILWCEWLLGNAVYYTKMKNKNQRLVIRAHRFELTREFGNQVDYKKVDAVFFVGYYYFEKFMERFSIPREKAKLLSNYVEEKIYTKSKTKEYQFHIAIVGSIPKRKGLYKGLKLLKTLVNRDKRYKLYVIGKNHTEISWIKNNPTEARYYEECEDYIRDNNLTEHVIYKGFIERAILYEDIGYVLSLSDDEEPESFHLAPAEGACAGCVSLLLDWPGVTFIYPKEVIYKSMEEIEEKIVRLSNEEENFKNESNALRQYIIDNYGMERFIKVLKRYLIQIRILG